MTQRNPGETWIEKRGYDAGVLSPTPNVVDSPTHSRIVSVAPMRRASGPVVYGDVVPVTLACGHTYLGNPTMYHKIGELARCHTCKP